MKIGLDFDDVIVHSQSLKPISARDLFGVDISANNFSKESVVGRGILTYEQYIQAVTDVYRGKYPLPEVPGSVQAIRQLLIGGHSVKIVTNRSAQHHTLAPAIDWLNEQGLSLEVIGVPYGNSKSPYCEDLDLFVDDEVDNLKPLVGIVPYPVLFLWAHHAHKPVPKGVATITGWQDLNRYVS